MIYSKLLGTTLRTLLETDPRVFIIGEDIADPYGGAFKVTKGLSTDFPNRVRTTPVSEGAIAGISAGLALEGYRPIAEFMFGDFISLAFDQALNHMAKYNAMYNGKATCPVILRTPSGGGRGYGPTHSQSLEKHFMGIPHFRIVAASLAHQPLELFQALLSQDEPALFVEHKLLYPKTFEDPENGVLRDFTVNTVGKMDGFPTISLSLVPREECSVTILAYGYQAHRMEEVVRRLGMEEEIFAELLIPSQICPLDYRPIEESVKCTGSLVTVEEGTDRWSWGSEVAREISERCFAELKHPVKVICSEADIIPSSRVEEEKMLVSAAKVESTIKKMVL